MDPGSHVKNTHKPRYCEKEKDKANKRILRSLSFDNNGLVKLSCGTVALYGLAFCGPKNVLQRLQNIKCF
jgi:hypothetical protein